MTEPVPEPLSFVSTFAWSGMEPLRQVVHDTDGSWQFLCNTTTDPMYMLFMHAEHVFDRFSLDLRGLSTLPRGFLAYREERGEEWVVERDVAEG